MPRYQSVDGKWFPVKEYHINANAKPGENPVYEGPDRAAVEVLKKEGVEYLGKDFRMNSDLRRKARELGYTGKTAVEDYIAEMHGVDIKENTDKTKKSLEETIHLDNDVVKRKQPINPRSGGDDTSGNNKSIKGGFGEPRNVEGIDSRA